MLQQLKNGQNIKKTVSTLSDEEINLLLKVLHLMGDGLIHLPERHKDSLSNSKKVPKLLQLGSRMFFKNLMKDTRVHKLKIVNNLSNLIPLMLESLFH